MRGKTYKIGWFSTGRDQAARELLRVVYQAIQSKEIPQAQIIFVFSNRERGEHPESDRFFNLVEGYKIPLICFSHRKFKPERRRKGLEMERQGDPSHIQQWRREYDDEVMKRLAPYHPDVCVLAGYMLIVGERMCHKYRMINLHPAKPGGPKGSWQEVIWQLIASRAGESGVMMHLVTPELDAGPAVTFCRFPIRGGLFDPLWQEMEEKLQAKRIEEIIAQEGENNPLFKEIRRHELIREYPLIVHTIKAFAEGKVKIQGDRTITVEGQRWEGGYDLTSIIDNIVKERL